MDKKHVQEHETPIVQKPQTSLGTSDLEEHDTITQHDNTMGKHDKTRAVKLIKCTTQKKKTQGINNEDLEKYLDIMYQNIGNDGRTINFGFNKIGKITGIKSVRKIFEYLKLTGVIDTENGATKLLKNRKGELI